MKRFNYVVTLFVLLLSFTATAAEQIYFVQTDHLGAPEILTDENQTIVWQASQDPFANSAPITEQVTFDFRFPGQYYDAESGLFYNWNRYYDAGLGRYVTSDPIGLGGGLNTFGYVGGNPLMFSDPTGLAVCGGACVGGIIIGGIIREGAKQAAKQAAKKAAKIAAAKAAEKAAKQRAAAERAGGAPGNCTPSEQKRLQEEVNASCKGNGTQSCSIVDSCPTLEVKLELNLACALAREKINNRCFNGGDAGHRIQAQSAWNAVQNCTAALAAKDCTNCSVP